MVAMREPSHYKPSMGQKCIHMPYLVQSIPAREGELGWGSQDDDEMAGKQNMVRKVIEMKII